MRESILFVLLCALCLLLLPFVMIGHLASEATLYLQSKWRDYAWTREAHSRRRRGW